MSGREGVSPPAVFASDRPLVFGHRGGAKLGPENTITAFARGLAAGADGVECDVRLSADGVAVVIHDPTLDRTTDRTGPVGALSAVALARVDATCRFQPADPALAVTAPVGVPTLQDVLEQFPGARVIIELKDTDDRLAYAVAALVLALGAQERVCVGSFNPTVLATLRAIAPGIVTSASRSEAQRTLARSWIPFPRFGAAAYRAFQVPERSGRLHVVRPAFVRQAHREGAVVQVWTVDAPDDVRRLLDYGVDGLISDRPDVTVPVRDAWVAARRAARG
ncbi:MAG: glycerophosphodiester phosphodiesterase [Acidobacteriota bacterium]